MKITCDSCNEKFEYEPMYYKQGNEIIESVDEMPDGYLRDGNWYCDECGSCPKCGKSLEKEASTLRSLCDDCKENQCRNCHGNGFYMGDTMVGTYEQLSCEECNGSGVIED